MRNKSGKLRKLTPGQLRKLLLQVFNEQPKKRLNPNQLIKKLQVANSRNSVRDALQILEYHGHIKLIKSGKYILSPGKVAVEPEYYEGYVDLTKSGSAYIICDRLEKDIYVAAKNTLLAMHGDRVKIQITRRLKNKTEGKVVEILQHATDRFVGIFRESKSFGFVIPDNRMIPFDIYIHPKNKGEANEGDKVLVEVLNWTQGKQRNPTGVVLEVLDSEDFHEVAMQSFLANRGFSTTFPKEVQNESENISFSLSDQEIASRKDFRGRSTITIDPANAKDFDDALSFQVLENGEYEVGVHIADVTHYLKPGSHMDKEAYRRSTSVYLVDRVAPMLPEKLSNELCSLRPDEDSLTFSAVFTFDPALNITGKWFGKSVIHSEHRYTYDEAQAVLNGTSGPFAGELKKLNEIALHLRKRRFENGSIAFESPEFQFELDKQNKPVSIKLKQRHEAHLLIEDFMLLANKEVAKLLARREEGKKPTVFRVHDQPDPEKIREFAIYMKELGFKFETQNTRKIKESFNRLAEATKTNELLEMIEPLAIRTMAKATYTTDNIGHFGLGFDYYTHFTSPIRRYSDVLVHRLLQQYLEGEKDSPLKSKEKLEEECLHISNQERKAQEAERDSIKYKQVEYISNFIGEEFHGVISAFIDRGFFVGLINTHIDGLVSFDTLDEAFEIQDNRLKARGRRSGRILKVGDKVTVRVESAHLEEMHIFFSLEENRKDS
jgi:ribonuclease R